MRFKTKIILTYSLLIFAITVGFGVAFRFYNIYQLKQKACQNSEFISRSLIQQVDEQIKTMESIPTFLLSDQKFLSACHTLASVDRAQVNNQSLVFSAKQEMQLSLNSFYLQKNYYRVNYFNSAGDFLSSNFKVQSLADGSFDIDTASWLREDTLVYNNLHLIVPHKDPWSKGEGMEVLSLIQRIQGKEGMGYVEVQKESSVFSQMFAAAESPGVSILVLWQDQVIYASSGIDTSLQDYYRQTLPAATSAPTIFYNKNTQLGLTEMIATTKSDYSGMTINMIQNQNIWYESTAYITVMTLVICFAICLLSFFFIFLLANRLTAPIGILRRKIEQTNIENLSEGVDMGASNDEIYHLETAYNSLTRRLQEAIVRETKISALQVQAQFDALQAQINPHFMFNVLNVLSHRGVINKDEVICDICDSLAAMLRYSTNTRQRFATIAEEIGYVQDYIVLLKSRYQQNLQCTIDVNKSIQSQPIPKIIIQQMVENAINHGYENVSGSMRIGIRGWEKNGYWHIVIRDDGQGFDPVILEELKTQMAQVESNQSDFHPVGMEIGGMGIINTYARLRFCYKEDLIFEIRNCKGQGALIHIGSVMADK